jgi:hypothetical protein
MEGFVTIHLYNLYVSRDYENIFLVVYKNVEYWGMKFLKLSTAKSFYTNSIQVQGVNDRSFSY